MYVFPFLLPPLIMVLELTDLNENKPPYFLFKLNVIKYYTV